MSQTNGRSASVVLGSSMVLALALAVTAAPAVAGPLAPGDVRASTGAEVGIAGEGATESRPRATVGIGHEATATPSTTPKPTVIAKPTTSPKSTTTAKARTGTKPRDNADGKGKSGGKGNGKPGSKVKINGGRSYAVTWQSNDAPTKDRAIYHCVRRNEIVGPAYIVDRNDATRFTCSYNKETDWPWGVMVYQPADRRLVVKVGPVIVHDYDPQANGRDVWVVKGNPTGWWRTRIK